MKKSESLEAQARDLLIQSHAEAILEAVANSDYRTIVSHFKEGQEVAETGVEADRKMRATPGRKWLAGRRAIHPLKAVVTSAVPGNQAVMVEAAGLAHLAEHVGGPYEVGDEVHLDWGAGSARVIGKVTPAEASA